MRLHVSSICAYFQEVKIALRGLWCHNTYYRCDDTRSCVMQFWPPDDEHMCSKHVEAWNKLIVKQKKKNCASSWLITQINILRCAVSKTSKLVRVVLFIWNVCWPGWDGVPLQPGQRTVDWRNKPTISSASFWFLLRTDSVTFEHSRWWI